MKKIFIILFAFILTSCSSNVTIDKKTPNELLLEIKDYSCEMKISSFSNKNATEYLANQTYSASGKYSMEFLDKEKLKINYENSILNISSNLTDENLVITPYEELNQNPLFLSYFIHTYFNLEEKSNIKITESEIYINLPNRNNTLTSAKLTFKNNLPYSLSYFDVNGNEKINIIYNKFTFI